VSAIGSDAAAAPSARGHETGSLFHSLYQDDGRRAAVSPVVAELWGGRPAPTRDAARPLAPASGNAPRGHSAHDLFRDMHPKMRAHFDRKA
jgi:hypothetical protein